MDLRTVAIAIAVIVAAALVLDAAAPRAMQGSEQLQGVDNPYVPGSPEEPGSAESLATPRGEMLVTVLDPGGKPIRQYTTPLGALLYRGQEVGYVEVRFDVSNYGEIDHSSVNAAQYHVHVEVNVTFTDDSGYAVAPPMHLVNDTYIDADRVRSTTVFTWRIPIAGVVADWLSGIDEDHVNVKSVFGGYVCLSSAGKDITCGYADQPIAFYMVYKPGTNETQPVDPPSPSPEPSPSPPPTPSPPPPAPQPIDPARWSYRIEVEYRTTCVYVGYHTLYTYVNVKAVRSDGRVVATKSSHFVMENGYLVNADIRLFYARGSGSYELKWSWERCYNCVELGSKSIVVSAPGNADRLVDYCRWYYECAYIHSEPSDQCPSGWLDTCETTGESRCRPVFPSGSYDPPLRG